MQNEEQVKLLKRELTGEKFVENDDELSPGGVVLLHCTKEKTKVMQEQANAY